MPENPPSCESSQNHSQLLEFFQENDWSVHHQLHLPRRQAQYEDINGLPLSRGAIQYLQGTFPIGIYRHQRAALSAISSGDDVCLATGTASGKSMVFYAAAIDELQRNTTSRILLVYPLKALGREQEGRLRSAVAASGMLTEVGRIDGQVSVSARASILQKSRLVIVTPDIVHAWLLSSMSENSVKGFLRRLSMVIVDEVHNYSGVFGSNSAFLFRRVEHAVRTLGGKLRYVAASATIANPQAHLCRLFGHSFRLIETEADTSPRNPVDILLVRPPSTQDLLSGLSGLFTSLAASGGNRFIAFVDSRKQVEYLSAIMQRNADGDEPPFGADRLDHMNILPFRAGYELQDRDRIQDRLSEGRLHGVISTSALELGIDIPYLDTGILVGVPQSRTSLLQRIGRIGRHKPGLVLVVHRGDLWDEQAFRDAESFMVRPLAESSLYLENQRIQYLHALCLARHGGEHDQVAAASSNGIDDFTSTCSWPNGFPLACHKERIGEVPSDLQSMKMEGGEDPNHIFPLRDVESQFQVELKQGPELRSLGSLSHGQVLREAYPGAIYYYTGQPFRVCKILQQSKKILVRKESHYTTKPLALPTLIFPNLSHGNVHLGLQYGELTAIECNLQVREVIVGYRERRGSSEFNVQYPLSFADTSIAFEIPRFTRNYFTTGIVITHPVLSVQGIKAEAVAKMIYEAFLSMVPFERQDVGVASDKHRADRGPITQGHHFIALHDQTYGSLRLSGRLLEDRVFRNVLEAAVRLGETGGLKADDPLTFGALVDLHAAATQPVNSIKFDVDSATDEGTVGFVEVVMPGSKGLDTRHNNEEFAVEKVFYSPSIGGLAYRGKHIGVADNDVVEVIPLESLTAIPGESKLGKYNPDTGDLMDL